MSLIQSILKASLFLLTGRQRECPIPLRLFLVYCTTWTSVTCSVLLMLLYSRFGRRHLLLTATSGFMASSSLLKTYLMGLRLYGRADVHFKPSWVTGPIIMISQAAVASYNAGLLLVCLHIWLIVGWGGAVRGYDGNLWQQRMLALVILLGIAQAIDVWLRTPNIWMADRVPFAWVTLVLLVLLLCISLPIMSHLLYTFYRTRERSMTYLKQSSISATLFWRFLTGIALMALVTGQALLTILTANLSVPEGGGGRFKAFPIFEATPAHIASRYLSGALAGLSVFLIFGTSEEVSMMLRRDIRNLQLTVVRILCLQGFRTSPAMKEDCSKDPIIVTTVGSAFPPPRKNALAVEQPVEDCALPRMVTRALDGSLLTASTILPSAASIQDSMDVGGMPSQIISSSSGSIPPAMRRVTISPLMSGAIISSPLHTITNEPPLETVNVLSDVESAINRSVRAFSVRETAQKRLGGSFDDGSGNGQHHADGLKYMSGPRISDYTPPHYCDSGCDQENQIHDPFGPDDMSESVDDETLSSSRQGSNECEFYSDSIIHHGSIASSVGSLA